ncbi:hypothetical protein MLD38_022743 [Melastoma candidum]|uniref:Uncharacterized protein n=1 Tax=Melastoma candidum TaxID=119954 RepID=A0ACB9QKC5_9MYRT|nr:hypothetical protein MLD38_022743 [Melastoma candidum]
MVVNLISGLTCRISPLWGAMKYLYRKIPEVASRKSQMYGYLLEKDKGLHMLPNLPEFPLSLSPEESLCC